MKKVLVIDTSILCVWLDIPGMEDCGPDADKWNRARVAAKIEAEERESTTFVLPLASIIETGNHIAQARNYRRERGESLAELIRKSANQDTPWAAFSDQSTLWTSVKLTELADSWPPLAQQQLSLGDVTIKDVAEFYAATGCRVEILTGDVGLKAYEPIVQPEIPRRKQRR